MSAHRQPRDNGIRFRLTRPGWVFAAMTVSLGLAALRTQQSMIFIMLGSFLGAMVASVWLARRMVSGTEVQRDVPDRVWQNQPVHLGYFVRNIRRRGAALGLGVEEVAPKGMVAAEGFCVHLPPQAAFRAGARFAARRRGRLLLGGVRIKTVFPFGLLLAGRDSHQPREIIVWPGRGRLKSNLLHQGASQTSARPPSRSGGGQDEFFGLREYRQGDSPRWIHWRRSAGRRVPVVREMAQPMPDVLWLVLDTRRDSYDDRRRRDMERSLRFAATLVEQAFARGYQVALAMGSLRGPVVIPPAAGRGQRRRVLDALACADENTTVGLDRILEAIEGRRMQNARVVVLTRGGEPTEGMAVLRNARQGLTVLDEARLEDVFTDQTEAEVR